MDTTGHIYILVNPAFSNLVKIGYSDNVVARLARLNANSGLPAPFRIYATYGVNSRLEDTKVHAIIDKLNPTLRYNRSREFYEMSPESIYSILDSIAQINGLENNLRFNPLNDEYIYQTYSHSAKHQPTPVTKLNSIDFRRLGIPVGSRLKFVFDDSLDIIVYDDKGSVIFNNTITTLKTIVEALCHSSYHEQSLLYFTYNDIRLADIQI